MRMMDVDVTPEKRQLSFFLIQYEGQKLVSQIIRYFFIQPPLHHPQAIYSTPILSSKFLDLFFILVFSFTLTNPSRG